MTIEDVSDSVQAGDDSAVVCEDVTHIYDRSSSAVRTGDTPSVTALRDVSLTINSGEFTVIAGASGSGKSTLLHVLGAIELPTEGRVLVDDVDTAGLSERKRAALRLAHIGIVFQRFHLLPSITARANVGVPLIERGLSKSKRRDRAAELLERVGMGDRLTHRPGELSGGEQQRVAIARALVGEPELLIADEPTGELDSETGRQIIEVLQQIAEDRAVVVATHDRDVITHADRVIELRDGAVIADER